MKLIRDNIHNYIKDKRRITQLNRNNEDTIATFIDNKLIEETNEVIAAPPENKLEELADVYEVLLAMGAHWGHSLSAIQTYADHKRQHLGGFRDRWVLLEDKDTPDTNGDADETFEALSATSTTIELEPGGKLWPVYYEEEWNSDYSDFTPWLVRYTDSFLIIPDEGIDGINIDMKPVESGDYSVEVYIVDYFNNYSNALEFPVYVPEDPRPQWDWASPYWPPGQCSSLPH